MRSLTPMERALGAALAVSALAGIFLAAGLSAALGFAAVNAGVSVLVAVDPRRNRPFGWALAVGWAGQAAAWGATGATARAGLALGIGLGLGALTEAARRSVHGRVLRGGPPNG